MLVEDFIYRQVEIEKQTNDSTTMGMQRHFFCHFLDQYTTKMGVFGNRIKDAHEMINKVVTQVNEKVQTIEPKLKETKDHAMGILASVNTHINDISAKIDMITDTFNKHLQLLDTKITAIETAMNSKINTSLTRIAQVTSQKDHFLAETTANLIAQIRGDLKECNKLLMMRLNNHANELSQDLEQSTQDLQSDLYNMVNQVTMMFLKIVEQYKANSVSNQRDKSPTASRWYNVSPNFKMSLTPDQNDSRNPYDRSYNCSDHHLQAFNHNEFIKHVNVMYNGPVEMYVFHNQLSIAAYHYRIYLHPLEEFQYNASLCPDAMGQHLITEQDSYQMTKALYEKLSSFDIIPVEFTAAQNILKCYA